MDALFCSSHTRFSWRPRECNSKREKIVIRKKGKILYEDIITYIENPETERLGLFRAFGKATGYSTNIQKVLPFLDTNNNLLGKM